MDEVIAQNSSRIHPSALVEPGARLGDRTCVWHYTHIRAGAVLGEDCMVAQGCYVAEQARIGSRVRIQNGVSVFNGVTLEDDVFVGPSVVFTNDRQPRCGNLQTPAVPTLVRQGASVGAGTVVVCGATIGRWAMTGAGAVVVHDVPDFALVVGNPARRIGWVCRCGLRLKKSSRDKWSCPECSATYERRGRTSLSEVAPIKNCARNHRAIGDSPSTSST